jgi:hypothetical protein
VNDAATSLNKFAQEQVGRHDISDKALMGKVFSDKDPEQGKSRLRCPGDHASETVRSHRDTASDGVSLDRLHVRGHTSQKLVDRRQQTIGCLARRPALCGPHRRAVRLLN